MENLTSKEWTVYNFLKKRTEEGLWTKQTDIQEHLASLGIEEDLRECRRFIYNIRRCNTIQKIIISSSKGYKIMTNIADQIVYLEKIKIKHLKGLKQYYREMDKLSKDGQMKITFNKYERDHIEALLKGED